jgi:hypothetical protein
VHRGITLIPVVSKVLEAIILNLCEHALLTDDLQFGFKRDIGCSDAIFALKSTINNFTSSGSTVYAAALDVSKAFDRVNHFKLFS